MLAFWPRLSFSILIAATAMGCPANRVCESSGDCPEPDRQLCVVVKESGVPAEICEEAADTACIAIGRGCRCAVGSWFGNEEVASGTARSLCMD